MIQSDEIKLPAEFQVALYENLIHELEKHGKFQRVYRDGDRDASRDPELVVLHSSVRGFKEGSERARQVTTVRRRHIDQGSLSIHKCGWQAAPGSGYQREGPVLWWKSQSYLRFCEEGSPCRTGELFSPPKVRSGSEMPGAEEIDC